MNPELAKSLDELNNLIKTTQLQMKEIWHKPFEFEHFEWKQCRGENNWQIFYKGQPLQANSMENRIEAAPKLEGLLLVAIALKDELIAKIKNVTGNVPFEK